MECKIIKEQGKPKISINGKSYEPLSFKSFRATERNISDFSKAGLKLFSILTSGMKSMLKLPYSLFGESWIDDEVYDFNPIDNQIDLFIKNAPDSYFALMIQLDTRDWWLNKRPGYPNSFWCLAQMSDDKEWRYYAAKYMKAVISHVEEKYGEKMYGYFLLCGTTTEWFSERDYEAPSPIKSEAYKIWSDDDTIEIPLDVDRDARQIFLDKEKDKELIKYREFSHKARTDALLYFAKEAQTIIKHNKLIGVYFGYVFELCPTRLWNTGHIDYERVFLSEDIDIISSPSSYYYRGQDSTSAFMVTYDTLKKHNKLYFLEFDQITNVAPSHIKDIMIPGGHAKCKNETETLNLMRRDFMLNITKGSAIWWFDMFEGWFYSEVMMNEISRMIETTNQIKNNKEQKAKVAFIVSADSLYYMNKNNTISSELLQKQRLGMALMGAPYDVFSSCDLTYENLKDYKMIVFMSQYYINKNEIDEIEKLKSENRLLMWCYGSGFVSENSFITDMEISQIPKQNSYVYNGKEIEVTDNQPFLGIEDNTAKPIALYNDSDIPAIAYKKQNNYISVYSAVANMSGDILREIAKKAGVHIYCENSDNAVYVGYGLIGVYHCMGKDAEISLLEDSTYIDLFTGKIYISKNKKIKIAFENEKAKLLIKQ